MFQYVLVTLASSPLRSIADIVAAAAGLWREHGVDCVIGAWRGATGPAGLTREQIGAWSALLRAAVATASNCALNSALPYAGGAGTLKFAS